MSSVQLGEALLKVASDPGLTEAFSTADCLDSKISLLKQLGYTIDASDFAALAQAVGEANIREELSNLSDADLSAAQGGFLGDIAGASIGLGLGAFFGGIHGASFGLQVGKVLGNVIDEAIGAVVKNETYDKLNKIFSTP
jgi:predicted ribosomally synthesized peptide with nif11-like leader